MEPISESHVIVEPDFRTFFEAIPVPSTVLLGKEHRCWLQNNAHRELTGRADIIGKPYREAFPESVEWELPILDYVYENGQALLYQSKENRL